MVYFVTTNDIIETVSCYKIDTSQKIRFKKKFSEQKKRYNLKTQANYFFTISVSRGRNYSLQSAYRFWVIQGEEQISKASISLLAKGVQMKYANGLIRRQYIPKNLILAIILLKILPKFSKNLIIDQEKH